MIELPPQLLKQLPLPQSFVLRRALAAVANELTVVYRANMADHRPARGDNALLFGLKIWVHLWHALRAPIASVTGAEIVDYNGTHQLRIGEIGIGIHKLGDSVDEDIHSAFPEGSPSQRG